MALWLSNAETTPPVLRRLRTWYDNHKALLLQSRTVSEWVEQHNRLSLQASWYSQRVQHGSGSTECIDVLKPLETSLILMEEHDMHAVVTDRAGLRGNFRMAYRASRKGDCIFRLENCSLPVVLRPQSDGKFALIGEALGRRDGKANDW